jgi:hypothetical protein
MFCNDTVNGTPTSAVVLEKMTCGVSAVSSSAAVTVI